MRTVLLVDADDVALSMNAAVLRSAGYAVSCLPLPVHRLKEAVEQARPDLVVISVDPAAPDAGRALRSVRPLAEGLVPRVVALARRSGPGPEPEGADCWVDLPCEPSGLLRAAATALAAGPR